MPLLSLPNQSVSFDFIEGLKEPQVIINWLSLNEYSFI